MPDRLHVLHPHVQYLPDPAPRLVEHGYHRLVPRARSRLYHPLDLVLRQEVLRQLAVAGHRGLDPLDLRRVVFRSFSPPVERLEDRPIVPLRAGRPGLLHLYVPHKGDHVLPVERVYGLLGHHGERVQVVHDLLEPWHAYAPRDHVVVVGEYVLPVRQPDFGLPYRRELGL